MYAVIQIGNAIYGTGATKEAAISDASQWVEDPELLEYDLEDLYEAVDGDLVLVPCSQALHEHVQAYGAWDVRYDIGEDGVARLTED